MAFNSVKKINDEINSLVLEKNRINVLKINLEKSETCEEYNIKVIELNKAIRAYEDRKAELKKHLA